MICPACAAGIASWMLAGSLGTGGAAAAVMYWRREKAGSIKEPLIKSEVPAIQGSTAKIKYRGYLIL